MTTLAYRSAEAVNSAMGRVYAHMSMAVLVSMLVSYLVGTTPELLAFFFTGALKWIVIFAPLVAIFAFAFAQERFNKGQLQLFLYACISAPRLNIYAGLDINAAKQREAQKILSRFSVSYQSS